MKGDVICWDSSVLISWIRGDEGPDKTQAIRTEIEQIERGSYKLAVSTLVYVEVLESTMPPQAMETFRAFIRNRQMIQIIAVDIRVAEKAQALRNRSARSISTPDAVHLATAVICGAKFFHTFDSNLLRLSGKDEEEALTITACHIPGTIP